MGLKTDMLLKEINKKAGDEILSKGLVSFEQYKRIPFTSPRLNYCTFGGLPIGKLIEFFGEEHGGKTTTALDIVANFQNMELCRSGEDGYVARDVLYCDCENSLNEEWARKLGVDVDSMYLLQPKEQSAEEIFEMILSIVATGEFGLVVLDSIGAMVSKSELEKKVEDATYAGISQALTKFSKKAEMIFAKYSCTFIGINQVRDDLNSSWGGYKTPGGRAWKHLCMVRIKFSRGTFIDSTGNALTRGAETPAGNEVNFSIEKIKSAPPTRRTGYYTLKYDIGVDYLNDLIEVAMKYGIIVKSGAWFELRDDEDNPITKIQGQANVWTYLSENLDVREIIERRVDKAMNE